MADNAQPPTNVDAEMGVDLEATLEADVNADATQPDAMNLDGANDAEAPQRNGVTENVPLEARIPAKKDATLREFLSKMDDYAPIACLPPAAGRHLLTDARFQTQSQIIISHVPAYHRLRKHLHTLPAFSRLQPRSSLPT
jgi:transcription initiation factor TFIID subunit 10